MAGPKADAQLPSKGVEGQIYPKEKLKRAE